MFSHASTLITIPKELIILKQHPSLPFFPSFISTLPGTAGRKTCPSRPEAPPAGPRNRTARPSQESLSQARLRGP